MKVGQKVSPVRFVEMIESAYPDTYHFETVQTTRGLVVYAVLYQALLNHPLAKLRESKHHFGYVSNFILTDGEIFKDRFGVFAND